MLTSLSGDPLLGENSPNFLWADERSSGQSYYRARLLGRHPPAQITITPKLVSTEVVRDVVLMLEELREGRVEAALGRYQALFFAYRDQPLTEELEVVREQDQVAQFLRAELLDMRKGAPTEAADLAESAWLPTKDQGFDPASFARLYSFFSDGKSLSVYEMQRVSPEYGLPLALPERASEPAKPVRPPSVRGPYLILVVTGKAGWQAQAFDSLFAREEVSVFGPT